MARYTQIPIITTPENTNRRYIKVKYPEIPRGSQDIYVYTTKGDRYDLLAQSYYGDPLLWWIIALCNLNNTTPDSIYPNIGEQIRIPASDRVAGIISEYETLNKIL
jgi:hypothetical protein